MRKWVCLCICLRLSVCRRTQMCVCLCVCLSVSLYVCFCVHMYLCVCLFKSGSVWSIFLTSSQTSVVWSGPWSELQPFTDASGVRIPVHLGKSVVYSSRQLMRRSTMSRCFDRLLPCLRCTRNLLISEARFKCTNALTYADERFQKLYAIQNVSAYRVYRQ